MRKLSHAQAAAKKARDHAAALKAARTRAKNKAAHKAPHHVTVSHKPVARKRAWSPDSDVACCSARAVAEAFRIALGRPVSDSAVLDLYWSLADDADAGASILATWTAAPEVWGLAGPRSKRIALPLSASPGRPRRHSSLVLGLDIPWGEPHAVTVGPDGTWWSWGEPHTPGDFPGAVIEEAWAVTCAG